VITAGFDRHMGWEWGWLFGLISVVASLLFLLAIIAVIVALVRSSQRRDTTRPPSTSGALSILEERYARGEIDRDEFLERRAVLHGGSPPPS